MKCDLVVGVVMDLPFAHPSSESLQVHQQAIPEISFQPIFENLHQCPSTSIFLTTSLELPFPPRPQVWPHPRTTSLVQSTMNPPMGCLADMPKKMMMKMETPSRTVGVSARSLLRLILTSPQLFQSNSHYLRVRQRSIMMMIASLQSRKGGHADPGVTLRTAPEPHACCPPPHVLPPTSSLPLH